MSDYDYMRGGKPGTQAKPPLLDKLTGISDHNKQALHEYFTNAGMFDVVKKRKEPMHPLQLIMARLRLPLQEGMKFSLPGVDDIHCYCEDGKAAIVFIVKDGKPVTIEDDVHLFPSDNLITQLRLLIGSNPAR